MVLLLPIFLVLGLLVVSWFYWTHRLVLHIAWKLPAVLPASFYLLLLFGNLKDISKTFHKIIKNLSAESKKTGAFWLGPYPMFVLADPNDVQIVLNSSRVPNRGSETKILKSFFGKGILSAPGHEWKLTRRYISPVFSPRSLEQTMPVLNECSRDLTNVLSEHAGQGQVDIMDDCSAVVVKASANFTFGPEMLKNLTLAQCYRYLQYLQRFRQLVITRIFKIWLRSDTIFRILKRNEIKIIEDIMGKFLTEPLKLVEERKNDKGRRGSSVYNTRGRAMLVDCLSKLQQDYPHFKQDHFTDEVKTMIQAGIETTSIIIPSCLMYLAAHPQIQERLHAEIVSVMGSGSDDVTLEHLKNMPFLDQVVKETLRLSSVIPMSSRQLDQDLKLGDCTFPAGTVVVLSFISMHFDPQHFPNPEEFDPDRFAPENDVKRKKGTFMPFSAGIRNCIGYSYAMMSMKTFVVHIVRKLKLSNPDRPFQPRYMVGVLCRTYEGYKVEFQRRHI